MNDLAQYNAAKSQLVPGTLVFSWGSGLLSHAIETLSGNGPSHVQVVERVTPDGVVWIAESTIENGVSGVQRNPLADSIAGYPKGSLIGAALLNDATSARADWSKLTPYIDSLIGKVAYDVAGLVKFLEPEGLREGQLNDKQMVCSSFATAAFEAIGILIGIPYSQVSPEWLLEMGIYSAFVPLLGQPKPHNFNVIG